MRQLLLLSVLVSLLLCQSVSADSMTVFLGTYTGGSSQGIYKCRLDMSSGKLSDLELAAETVNPSFLALHPNGQYLYAVGEIDDFGGQKTGGVSAYRIDGDTHRLTLLNQTPSGGRGPCHLVVDHKGGHVLVANYGGGSCAVIAISADGKLGEQTSFRQHVGSSVNPNRQQSPHAHSINVSADNKFAFVADLGLDKVLVYRFSANTGSLTPHDPPSVSVPSGGGPRHFAFHPSGKFAFSNNEILSSVNVFRYDANKGVLTLLQTISTLPAEHKGNSTAETQVHPNGKFVYVSNRGHNSIAAFRFDAETGNLSKIENESTQGKTPRNFGIDPTGTFLLAANQSTNDVFVFRIDKESGALEPTSHKLDVPSAVCVKFLPN
jgi:6-phosphogluconolactonase